MMKVEKIEEALTALDALIEESFGPVSVKRCDTQAEVTSTDARTQVEHLRQMIATTRTLLVEGGRREKVMRWLGFIQGVVWSLGLASIDTLKAMNTPDAKGA